MIHNEYLGELGEFYRQNQGLIYDTVYKYMASAKEKGMYEDDVLSVASQAFIKAYENYDSEYGTKFSTVACRYMQQAIWNESRKVNRERSRYGLYSLEKELETEEGDLMFDKYMVATDDISYVQAEELLKTIASVCTEREMYVIGLRLQQYTQLEIGELLSCTQRNVSNIMCKIRRKVLQHFQALGIAL